MSGPRKIARLPLNLMQRHTHAKDAAATQLAFDPHAAAMLLDDRFHDRQPQPGSFHPLMSGIADTIEPLEQMRRVVERYAQAGVRDLDDHIGRRMLGDDVYAA